MNEPAGIDAHGPEEVVEGFLGRMRAPVRESPAGRFWSPGLTLPLVIGCLVGVLLGMAVFPKLAPLTTVLSAAVSRDPELVPVTRIRRTPVSGLLRFRGNPTHTYYGEGPLPVVPRLLWRFPEEPMCSVSWVGTDPRVWCGTGWTGQPVVWERPDGVTEVIVGAYDRAVHFVDAKTGKRTRPDFKTGDIVKGSVTLDPDGDPLLYFGSRDNRLRIVALDRPRPVELWSLNASFVPGMWNNDWDGNPLVVDDMLYEGGENGYLFAFRLHRDYDERGRVTVSPEPLLVFRGWNARLLEAVGDRNISIENSVAVFEDRLYFANSAGRVVGLDISQVHAGRAPVVFDFWVGDDVDASIVVDEEGMLYVSVELERFLPRSDEIGQLIKLDPYHPKQPVVWSLAVPPSLDDWRGGIWSTPALADEVLYFTTHSGMLGVVDRDSGQLHHTEPVGPHAWSSPVLVENQLLVATCKGELLSYSLENPRHPVKRWTIHVPTRACIESTPAVWKGRIIVGARDGYLYAFGEESTATTTRNGVRTRHRKTAARN